MPIFAGLIGSLASAFASLFSKFMGFQAALRLASYTAWILVLQVFLVSVFVCVSSLHSMLTSAVGGGGGAGSWVSLFWMGLGMFIPSNAAAVLSCLASVWIGTNVYKVQKEGIHHYSK